MFAQLTPQYLSFLTPVFVLFEYLIVRNNMYMYTVDGAFHDVDSSVMAFEIAGRAAAKEGLARCRSRLKEPIMKVVVYTPEISLGDVIGDLNGRRGQVVELSTSGQTVGSAITDQRMVTAFVPLANMFSYVSTLRSISRFVFHSISFACCVALTS
jgi:translation elongation factor EF-G